MSSAAVRSFGISASVMRPTPPYLNAPPLAHSTTSPMACFLVVAKRRGRLKEREFQCLARVVGEQREKHHFLLTAWVFLPDHWHAILFPRIPLTLSRVMESIKVGSTLRLNAQRKESGLLWQPWFFGRALRTVRGYYEKVEYIHLNPVRAGLVERAEDWPWSSVRDYAGSLSGAVRTSRLLPIDRILFPADERTRI